MKKIIAALAVAGALAGCAGTPFEWNDARRIKPGMTIAEVTQIMGSPYMTVANGAGLRYTWSYATAFTGARAVTVTFVDGKVTAAPPIPASY